MSIYALTFYDNLSDYSEEFFIGFFLSYDEAENTAKKYLKEVSGFKDHQCKYEIKRKNLIGEIVSTNTVSMILGWNINSNLNEIDIWASDLYADESEAQIELANIKKRIERQKWIVDTYKIGECNWQEGFIRVKNDNALAKEIVRMSANFAYTAQEALEKLKEGNKHYISAEKNEGDISPALREQTCAEGQSPYAVIITCSDSRVIPESIFSAGIGELFVIRVAGNVIDNHQLGSIEYAAHHLGCQLIVVMGHDHCGAVGAAISDEPDGYVKSITDEIKKAIGGETDDYKASCLNVLHSVKKIENSLGIGKNGESDLCVCGALYHLEDGRVEFL